MSEFVSSLRELADELDVGYTTVRRWRDKGMPSNDDGTWHPDSVAVWAWETDGRRVHGDSTEWDNRGVRSNGSKAEKIGARAARVDGRSGSRSRKRNRPAAAATRANDGQDAEPDEMAAQKLALAQATARYRFARATEQEVKLAERMGALIPVEDVEASIRDRILEAKAVMFAIPQRVAKELEMKPAREIATRLYDEITRVCQAMAKRDRVFPEGFEI